MKTEKVDNGDVGVDKVCVRQERCRGSESTIVLMKLLLLEFIDRNA